MTFIYEAIDRNGRRFTGELNLPSRQDALRQLQNQGLTPLRLEQKRRALGRRRHLRAEELNMAFHELATLLAAGVTLAEAVAAQERTAHHPVLAAALEVIGSGLRSGQSFPAVLEASGLPLPKYVYQLVAAGELTGDLAGALRDCAQQLEYERRTRAEITGALVYPSILVLSGLLAIATLFVFVVPKFANLLDEVVELPWLAWIVLSTGVWSNGNAGLLMLIVLGLCVGVAMGLSNERLRDWAFDQLARVPLVGEWLLQAEIAQWSKVLGTLLGNRVALVDALELAGGGMRIARQRQVLERVTQDVRGGTALSVALEERQAITAIGANLVRVGEASGQLAEMLLSLATLYEEAGRGRMKKTLVLIEPLAILLIGSVFGLIITGVVLAITSANDMAL
ncbi:MULTISPECIES: type II secretion system F family protein [Pseudomonas]|uniref:type II secretion system F family protein n=1 Tax=Pseudomonadaceae TaxID=135621 RepID=UPI0003FB296F|nr:MULTISPECIES: type II secretion system F family protein [Pseudomonas]MDE3738021.1 type II secretion system F family protein [Pseudomonas resinovorans]